ncbi:ethanolamine ammonia-lyase subunit EutC [Nocardioides sp. Leaf374]|uniref:ethanolamine ammonia-lyase subunit EutC n=1 Tax=Nocardioides sp. Leaf374 TaxID=2876560 RepID=UPI001E373C5F|nr:ethanolamine ammonia-lyase subunit EutC [Nocardioides sp. Leaf374]
MGDLWSSLRTTTQARIGLGRAGDALPTRRVLEFQAAHAAARDAVHEPLDVDALAPAVAAVGLGEPLRVTSRATSRAEYLRRPDLGRQPADLAGLAGGGTGVGAGAGAGGGAGGGAQVGIVLADGLSPRALVDHGPGLLAAIVAALRAALGDDCTIAPPVIATQARVALADHVGEALGVETLLVVIGERPGLSVADSLGIYLTHHPRPGRSDAERNCVSNVHPPDGLSYERAAAVVAGLVRGARELGASGVRLKDSSLAPELAAD